MFLNNNQCSGEFGHLPLRCPYPSEKFHKRSEVLPSVVKIPARKKANYVAYLLGKQILASLPIKVVSLWSNPRV